MRLVLTTDGVLRYNELTFVSHSMGGLVTRAFIIKYRDVVPKIRRQYFFATPTAGKPYVVLTSIVIRNSQVNQLYPMQSDNYLGPLQSNWLAAQLGLKSYCTYETQPIYGQIIVALQSDTNLCTQRLDPNRLRSFTASTLIAKKPGGCISQATADSAPHRRAFSFAVGHVVLRRHQLV